MKKEIISAVEVMDSGKLLLVLESGGSNSYQYVYREGLGIYWDNEKKGFHSNEGLGGDWSYSDWFMHIIKVVKTGVGVDLCLSEDVIWSNISEKIKNDILRELGQS